MFALLPTIIPSQNLPVSQNRMPREPEISKLNESIYQKDFLTRSGFFAPMFCPINVVVATAKPLTNAPTIVWIDSAADIIYDFFYFVNSF